MTTHTGTLNWHIPLADHVALDKVMARAAALFAERNLRFHRMDVLMDLTAAHANGCPMDFEAMAKGGPADFAHDLFGIRRHIDRKTGTLGGFFLPRFAKRGG